jgi:hypothetical protein
MRRNPTYDFKDRYSTGINTVPLKSIIHVIDSNGRGKPKIVQIISKAGLNTTTNIDEFLRHPELYIDLNEVDEIPSELEKIQEGSNTGWRILDRNPDNYGNIGDGAVDFSYSPGASNIFGAGGSFAFATGYETTASGNASHSEGFRTIAAGTNSHAMGENTIALNNNMLAIGQYNAPKNNTLFEIGNGSNTGDRNNIIEAYLSGEILAPSLTNIVIDGATSSVLITKNYIEDTLTNLSINDLSDVDTETGPPLDNQTLKWKATINKWIPMDDEDSGNLKSDGTIPMDLGYRPQGNLDLVTKEYSDLVNGGTF